jgi:predicted nuclease with RNAse H fold
VLRAPSRRVPRDSGTVRLKVRRHPQPEGPTEQTVAGLDLAGSEARRTGGCELRRDMSVRTCVLGSDTEVLRWVIRLHPALVAIDAPLSLPDGRRDLDDRTGPHFRACDYRLRELRIPFFPLTLGPMRMLTARGMRLRGALEAQGIRVVESYPGGVQDILGWPRKADGVERLRQAMIRAGFEGDVHRRSISHDELDAIACAYAALLQLNGLGQLIGDPAEGQILLPCGTVESPRSGRRRRAGRIKHQPKRPAT